MKGCARVKVCFKISARGDVLHLKDPTKLISADLHFLLDVVTEGIVVPQEVVIFDQFATCMV